MRAEFHRTYGPRVLGATGMFREKFTTNPRLSLLVSMLSIA